jgi:hypothetical protein
MNPQDNQNNKYTSHNTILYLIAGSLLLGLGMLAYSVWNPGTTSPQDIMPAAGSSAYIADPTFTENAPDME